MRRAPASSTLHFARKVGPRWFPWLVLPLLLLLSSPSLLEAETADNTEPAPLLLILDASGSMWGQIDGENKIVIARRVLADLIGQLPDEAHTGLVAYGHRREGDCQDIETLAPLGAVDRAELVRTVEGINPKGKTPITAAVEHSLGLVDASGQPTTVILLSDGLETCGGDPCRAVRLAKEAGSSLLLHVIGFDVEGEDLSQLECMAQAGGGLFLTADDADQLASALDTAIALPVDAPVGRLAVHAVADGELQDVSVRVTNMDTGKEVAVARTYRRAETNPSSIPLPDGRFEVKVRAIGVKGDVERHFEIEIVEGDTVERRVDFGTGELLVGATRNGGLGDVTLRIYVAGTNDEVATNRTYTSENTNPKSLRLTAGTYDVALKAVEIEGYPTHRFEGLEVEPGGRVEVTHEFPSGTLKVGAVVGSERTDATVSVVNLDTGKSVAQGRTYTAETSNPKAFEVSPGRYRVSAKGLQVEGKPRLQQEVTVTAGETTEIDIDFGG